MRVGFLLSIIFVSGLFAGEASARWNFRPVFTSPGAANTPENTSGIVYQASATDRDGDALASL